MTACSRSGHVCSVQAFNWQQALTAVLASEREGWYTRAKIAHSQDVHWRLIPFQSSASAAGCSVAAATTLPASVASAGSVAFTGSAVDCLRALKIALNNASESLESCACAAKSCFLQPNQKSLAPCSFVPDEISHISNFDDAYKLNPPCDSWHGLLLPEGPPQEWIDLSLRRLSCTPICAIPGQAICCCHGRILACMKLDERLFRLALRCICGNPLLAHIFVMRCIRWRCEVPKACRQQSATGSRAAGPSLPSLSHATWCCHGCVLASVKFANRLLCLALGGICSNPLLAHVFVAHCICWHRRGKP